MYEPSLYSIVGVYFQKPFAPYSMEQTFNWMSSSAAASQDSTCIPWNPKVHFHIHNTAPLVPFKSQFNPIHVTSCPLPILFIWRSLHVQIPSVPVSSTWSLSLRFLHQNHALTSLITLFMLAHRQKGLLVDRHSSYSLNPFLLSQHIQ